MKFEKMATYSNPHWLLSHIRNSFISTDDTGMCETVMASDDLPKCYLKRFQGNGTTRNMQQQQQRRSLEPNQLPRNLDPPLQEVDFICYPGLDQSDDEDIDLAAQSFDIQMYPEIGAHRFRSNTAQKLEKMDIARRKAARIKNVSFLDEVTPPAHSNFFQRKPVIQPKENGDHRPVKSKLSQQLANSSQQPQSKFQEYAKFDGTSQTDMHTQRINVFLNMLPEKERNYPIKLCVMGTAKIHEVIGFICYKASLQFPNLFLKSVRHYGLYMTEDNDDFDDFPPLDNKEPFSKFGFSHLTLAELKPAIRVELDQSNAPNKSMTLEEEKLRLVTKAVYSLSCNEFNPLEENDDVDSSRMVNVEAETYMDDFEQHILTQDDMLEAPVYRTFNIHMIDKRFFRSEVTLGISGERIEIDQHKHSKFWAKQRAVTYPLDAVAHCEIVERRAIKAVLRIWLRAASSITPTAYLEHKNYAAYTPSSPTSPSHYQSSFSSPFSFLNASHTNTHNSYCHQPQIRFKHYDFETALPICDQINKKLNCVLEMRSSEVRKHFLQNRTKKLQKTQSKKQFKF